MSRTINSKAEEEAKVAGRVRSQKRGERRRTRGGRAVRASSSPPPSQLMRLRRETKESSSAAVAGLSFFYMLLSLSHPAFNLQPPACPAVVGQEELVEVHSTALWAVSFPSEDSQCTTASPRRGCLAACLRHSRLISLQ
jgi:hypothetical protein